MKTLKKTLCLVLAVVMVVGVLILPVNAADYTDAAKIDPKYETAVNVLTELQVFTGKEAGAFDPTANLTRAEAATLVARIALGPTYASMLKATSVYSDTTDPKYAYALGAIAYGTQEGIINGVGGDKFDPSRNVTGLEMAKMLLVTIGADWQTVLNNGVVGSTTVRDENRYTGALWEINVIRDYQSSGLSTGLEAITDLHNALTREQTAQMILNAIKFQRPIGTTTIRDPENGTTYTTEIWTDPLVKTAFNVDINPYCHDSQGVPYEEWTLDGEVLYQDYKYKLVGSYDDKFSETVAKNLGFKAANVETYYNGVHNMVPHTGRGNGDYTDFYAYTTATDTRAVQGYEVDVYQIDVHYTQSAPTQGAGNHGHFTTSSNTYYDLVVKEALLARVGRVTDSKAELTVYPAYGQTKTAKLTVSSKDAFYDEISEFSRGDYVAIYLEGDYTIDDDDRKIDGSLIDFGGEVEKVAVDVTHTNHGYKNGSKSNADVVKYLSNFEVKSDRYLINRAAWNLAKSTNADRKVVYDAPLSMNLYLYNDHVLGVEPTNDPAEDNVIMVTDAYLSTPAGGGKVFTAVDYYNSDGELVEGQKITTVDGESYDLSEADTKTEIAAMKAEVVGKVYELNGNALTKIGVDNTTRGGGKTGTDGKYLFVKDVDGEPIPASYDYFYRATGNANYNIGKGDTKFTAANAITLDDDTTARPLFMSDVTYVYYKTDGKFAVTHGSVNAVENDKNKTRYVAVVYYDDVDESFYVKCVFVIHGDPEKATQTYDANFIKGINNNYSNTFNVDGETVYAVKTTAYCYGEQKEVYIECDETTHRLNIASGFYNFTKSYVYSDGDEDITIYQAQAATGGAVGRAKVYSSVGKVEIGGETYSYAKAKMYNVEDSKDVYEIDVADVASELNGMLAAAQVDSDKVVYIYVYGEPNN